MILNLSFGRSGIEPDGLCHIWVLNLSFFSSCITYVILSNKKKLPITDKASVTFVLNSDS